MNIYIKILCFICILLGSILLFNFVSNIVGICFFIIGVTVLLYGFSNEPYARYNTVLTGKFIDNKTKPFIINNKVNETKLFSKKYMDTNIQKENLTILKNVLESHNIVFFIDCGTLLGAVREGSFIDGDTDADISISRDDLNKLINHHLRELEQLGFISFRNSPNWMAMSLLRKGEYIDFYTLYKTEIPFELIKFPFLNTEFNIPKHYDEYLTELYGDWKTPKRDGKGLGNWEKGMPSYVKKYSLNMDDKITKQSYLLDTIVHFRYKPSKYKKWTREFSSTIDTLVNLSDEPIIFSKFDYQIFASYLNKKPTKNSEIIKTVLCYPEMALTYSFKEFNDLSVNEKRVLVVMGEDTRSSSLSKKSKNIIMNKFSTIFWEANDDPSFLTLPMGLNNCYIVLNGVKESELAITNSINKPKQHLLCIPKFNKFSTELNRPDRRIPSRDRLNKFIDFYGINKWFDVTDWDPLVYYENLSNYKFSICPTGNGIQAPKIFESLLVRTIPIVENELAFRQLKELGIPLLIVNNWDELSPELLEYYYDNSTIDWDYVHYLFSTRGVIDTILKYT